MTPLRVLRVYQGVVADTPPAQMSAPTLTGGAESATLTLATPAPDDGGSAITLYNWEVDAASGDFSSPILTGSQSPGNLGSSITVSPLTAGDYKARSWAVNAEGAGTPSAASADATVTTISGFPEASGGTSTDITDPNDGLNYTAYTFTADDDFVVTTGGEFEYLIVGPGGPGGSQEGFAGTGGGAGGDVLSGSITLPAGTYPVALGTSPAPSADPAPALGTSTTALGFTSLPGGRGSSFYFDETNGDAVVFTAPQEGGGGRGGIVGITTGAAGATHTTQYEGGDGFEEGSEFRLGGGGRGAGGNGADAVSGQAGDGGPGVVSAIDGTSKEYGQGGGGGGRRPEDTPGAPNGNNNGGNGGDGVNPGDGGGGTGSNVFSVDLGGAGAPGIVIIRHRRT